METPSDDIIPTGVYHPSRNRGEKLKSGFVALAGKPNVGKSTLINGIMKRKVVIVSDKPQTTRNRINCILTGKDFQIVFTDTPGIHRPLHRLGEYMVKIAIRAMQGVDLILFVVDATEGFGKPETYVARYIEETKISTILVVNKIDLLKDKKEACQKIEAMAETHTSQIVDSIYVSAVTGENLELLLQKILDKLPEGPQFYPEDMVTDRPLEFMVAELIREKIFNLTSQEVPHSTGVGVDALEERENGVVYILATIYVERDSQKGIIIGKGGRMIKEIGMMARKEIEFLLGKKVFLELRVKTKDKWRNRDGIILTTLGLRSDLG
ncbi:MAG: GTPase Era [Thermotogae bacterium]|nr:MAG: GTPase Era [Thermotogota bacterium]